ncbi:nuclear transport factor 2 family protein [Streptomyces formicae]|uniref:Nuclear transport factor 2 family protein n=1 Tax=Streptomyces formicae TaxID=1616117 RepID=A0ABY3WXT6_9ACTN|nr:nuclear transport factor 2 family protein [Streptomyces formicae]UNM16102.1 nuclear transport factor 2 family protein [Streptomyces formicae]
MNIQEIAETWVDAYNRQDTERYHALYSDNPEVIADRFGIRIRGKQANRELISTYLAVLPDGRMTVKSLIPGDHLVAMEVDFVGTVAPGFGKLPGLPDPGQRFSAELCVVLEFHDGLICRERDYSDLPH